MNPNEDRTSPGSRLNKVLVASLISMAFGVAALCSFIPLLSILGLLLMLWSLIFSCKVSKLGRPDQRFTRVQRHLLFAIVLLFTFGFEVSMFAGALHRQEAIVWITFGLVSTIMLVGVPLSYEQIYRS